MPTEILKSTADLASTEQVRLFTNGGLSSSVDKEVIESLNAISLDEVNTRNNSIGLDSNGKVLENMLPEMVIKTVTLTGPVEIVKSINNVFTITNYDAQTTYAVSVSRGTVSRIGDKITVLVTTGMMPITLSINNRSISIPITTISVNKPTLAVSSSGTSTIKCSVLLSSSVFSMAIGVATHQKTDWEVYDDDKLTNLQAAWLDNSINKRSIEFKNMKLNKTYYARCRYVTGTGKKSEWSDLVQHTTRATYAPVEESILLDGDPVANEYFGNSVSMSSDGSRCVVGAYSKTGPAGTSQGAAYIFTRSGVTWTQEAKLLASDPSVNDYFGASVSISSDGGRCVVGAYNKTGPAGTKQGAAYIFTRSGSAWVQEAKLLASDAAGGDVFGNSVSMSSDGSRCVVGAHSKTGPAGNYQGAAYIFTRSGSTWSQEAKLLASDAAPSDQFGYSVSMSGDGVRCIVGAHNKSGPAGNGQGAAYIYIRSGTTWTQEAKLLHSDPATYDLFGISVSMSSDGSRCVVGAYSKTGPAGTQQGAAYIFTRSGSAWVQEAKLLHSDPVVNDRCGYSVSMSGDGFKCAVGVLYKPGPTGDNEGAVYIFTKNDSGWSEQRIKASDAKAGAYFGWSVSMSSDGARFCVGSPLINNVGAAYVFS